MKKLILVLALLLLPYFASAQVSVRGYTRKDGTYVAPHYRSSPNYTTSDNYSTKGNVNPYTGKRGYVEPDSDSTIGYRSYSNPTSQYIRKDRVPRF